VGVSGTMSEWKDKHRHSYQSDSGCGGRHKLQYSGGKHCIWLLQELMWTKPVALPVYAHTWQLLHWDANHTLEGIAGTPFFPKDAKVGGRKQQCFFLNCKNNQLKHYLGKSPLLFFILALFWPNYVN